MGENRHRLSVRFLSHNTPPSSIIQNEDPMARFLSIPLSAYACTLIVALVYEESCNCSWFHCVLELIDLGDAEVLAFVHIILLDVLVVQQAGAELQEGGFVQRLREDVSDHDIRADPERLRDQAEELLAPIHQPALVVPVALSRAGVLDRGDGGLVVVLDGDR